MKDVLTYKNFIGSVHFDAEDETFYGKIEGINDLVTFEGLTVKELTRSFHEAVNDYIRLCKKAGRESQKSCKGSFNIRVGPEIHRKAADLAAIKGISLNQLVRQAVEKEVRGAA